MKTSLMNHRLTASLLAMTAVIASASAEIPAPQAPTGLRIGTRPQAPGGLRITPTQATVRVGHPNIPVNTPLIANDAPAAHAKAPQTAKPNTQMQAVLDALAGLDGKPLTSLSAEEARKQPSPADAVKSLMKKDGKEKVDSLKVEDIEIRLSDTNLKGRIYRPEGDGPFPVILYIHGGGWVIADLDTYDSSPRALCKATNALVISTHYRQAPEHKFPVAHNDVYGAYQWTMENAGRWSGNGKQVAVVGESAGGNMAIAVCMMAQTDGKQMPVHQVLVYPVANTSMVTESYMENKDAKPLGADLMNWFMDKTLTNPTDAGNPLIATLQAKSLKGLPPATIITAQIDPLRSEGEELAKKLEADGVEVTYKNYDGVTHEFFGMGAVVDEARQAVELVAGRLKEAFEK